MPTDIRQFFAKKGVRNNGNNSNSSYKNKNNTVASSSTAMPQPPAPKPLPTTTKSAPQSTIVAATTTTTTATTSSLSNSFKTTPAPHGKEKRMNKNGEGSETDDSDDVPKAPPVVAANNRKRIAIRDDDDDNDDNDDDVVEFVSNRPLSSSLTKKLRVSPHRRSREKVVVDLMDDDDDNNSSNNNDGIDDDDDDEEPVVAVASSRKAPTQRRIARRSIQDDDDDDNDDDNNHDEEGGDSDDVGDDDEYVSKGRKKVKTTPARKSSRSSPRRAAKRTPSALRSASKAIPNKRDPPLVPDRTLESIDVAAVASQCLVGYTFCLTGILSPSVSREDVTEWIKILGGRVTGSVSGKTDYLIIGDTLEDGRPYHEGKKYQLAISNNQKSKSASTTTHLVKGLPALYGLIQQYHEKMQGNSSSITDQDTTTTTSTRTAVPTAAASPGTKPAPAAVPSPTIRNPYTSRSSTSAAATTTTTVSNPYAARSSINPYAQRPSNASSASRGSSNIDVDDVKPAAVQSSSNNNNNNINMLWVDRYKPTRSVDILGNQDAVKKLSNWLQRWEDVFLQPRAIGKTFSSPQGPWKAALLSGPPGIGKTTTATLVAMESGRDILEFNASDVRSKRALQDDLGDITGSQSFDFRKQVSSAATTTTNRRGKQSSQNEPRRNKRIIIMDEVDGLGAGDRGGMAELIQMIKKSRVPIICICNDRQSQKMKSLLPYCMDLRYRRPVKSVIAKRAIQVAVQEGLSVEANAAEAIIESCGNDIRQVLNCLQMWASNRSSNNNSCSNMTYRDLKSREHVINKDEILRVSLFDAARLILEGRRGLAGADVRTEKDHFFRRNDAYFVDYSFVGLLVQQNYLKIMQTQFAEAKRKSTSTSDDADPTLQVLERMHLAADCMSDFAMVESGVVSAQNWSLLPVTAMLAVKTGFHAGGDMGGFLPGFPEFTAWLGKNSSKGKKLRLLHELQHHMNYKISGGIQEMRLSYLPVLRDRMLSMLSMSSSANIDHVVELMDDYGLDRDDVFEKLDEFRMDSKSSDGFDKIDSKTKAALTRSYNAQAHLSQALHSEIVVTKKGKRKSGGGGDGGGVKGDPDAIDDDAVENDDEENEDEDNEEENEAKIKALFQKKGRRGGGEASGKAAKSKRSKK